MSDTITISNTDTKEKVQLPSQWKVILHNDDFTPFEFVMELLVRIFHKSAEEAAVITLAVHQSGLAVVGVYTKEVAETKVDISMKIAKDKQHPLKVTSERE